MWRFRAGAMGIARLSRHWSPLPNAVISRGISWNGQVVAARRPVFVGMGAAIVPLPPGAFLQATRQGAAALVEAVLEATDGAKSVVDLFSGVGTFALPMARLAQVHAVDSDPELLAALGRRLARWHGFAQGDD